MPRLLFLFLAWTLLGHAAASPLFLEKDQRVRLEKNTVVRDVFDFRNDAKVKFSTIPGGAELRVLAAKRLPSGNYGVQVEYASEGRTVKSWLYYQPHKPELAVIGVQQALLGPDDRETPAEASLRKLAALAAVMRGDAPTAERADFEKFAGYPIALELAAPFTPRSSAGNCGKVDLRERFGDVRNQDGLGWCYAYVASDLMSFYMKKSPSPFELSLRFFQREKTVGEETVKMLKDGASVGRVLNLAQLEGFCLERDVPSTDYLQSYLSSLPPGDPVRAQLDRLHKTQRYDWLANVVGKIENFHEQQRGDLLKNPSLTCEAALAANLLFPKLDMATILAALKSGKSKVEVFNWLAHFSCPSKESLPSDRVIDGLVARGKSEGARLLGKLDEVLDKGEPAAIAFDIRPFHMLDQGDALHMSLIVSREFRDGKCQYLIRNTWGPSCAGYKRPCERGHFWVTEEDFHQNVQQIEFLRRR